MQATSRFTLGEDTGRGLEIRRDGRSLGIAPEGRRIEAQFELGDGEVLLWLVDDSPYDEGLHIYLIGRSGQIVDAIEAGVDFTAGIPRIHATGEDWVRFEFFTNGVEYRLDILGQPAFRWRLPVGWRYKQRLRLHRLVVTEAMSG